MPTAPSRTTTGLAYRDLGDPNASVVLVIHGMAEQGAEVLALGEALAGAGHRVVVPDLPGHGSSPGVAADLPIERLADALAAMCGELGLSGAGVVGHSLGGAVATALAAAHPDLVARMVLIDPGMAFPEEARAGFGAMYDSLTAENIEPTLRETLPPILFGPGDPPEVVDSVMAGMIGMGLEKFVALGRGLVAFDSFAALDRIDVPVLFVGNATPLAAIDNLRSRLSELSEVSFDDLSHQGLVNDPRVHTRIAEFLAAR